MPNRSGTKQLDAENSDLRARLEKAETTLSEVLGGGSDAISIPGVDGAQLYLLKDANQSYRTLIENMSEGALTMTQEGLVLYANQSFARMSGTPLEKVIGSEISHWFTPESQQVVQALLQKEAIDNYPEELNLAAADGTQVPIYISVSRLVLDGNISICMVVTDLTEQKHNEAILAEEKQAHAILEQAADAIVICNESGRIIRASKRAQAFYGKSPLGQLFDHAFPLRHLDGTAYSSIGTNDPEYSQSVEALLNNNEREWNVLASIGRLKNAEKEVLGSVITLTDITERKTAELALKNKGKQLSEVMTIAKMGYWTYETATDEFIFNDQYYLLHNITVDEAGGYRMPRAEFVRRYISPDFAPAMAKDMQSALTSKNPVYSATTESCILSGDNEIIWVEVRYKIQRDLQGNITHMIGIVQDINDRKLEELKLLESERRFRTMFNQVPLGIALIDSLDGSIHEVNPRFAEIAGRSMEEMLNIDWLQITHPDDLQEDLDNMALLNAGKINGFQMEKRYLHPDGKAVWISMTIAPLNEVNKTRPRHLCMIYDITDFKAKEARIKYLNRVHAVLSGISTLIVRVTERDELFRESCNIAIDKGGFRLAMIVIVDKSSMLPKLIISAGNHQGPLKDIKKDLLSGKDMRKSMITRAIMEKKIIISNDTGVDFESLYGDKFANAGINSIAVLPLIIAGEAVGAFCLYAEEADFFHEREMMLLNELVNDIAFSIDHIDKQELLHRLAYYDVLTGLANRDLFLDRVTQHIHDAGNGKPGFAIALIDLERFKNINISLGRPTGDELLQQVAAWLAQYTQDASLLARIDADRFALVLPKLKPGDELAKLVEKLMTAFLQHSFRLKDSIFRIGIKAGIAHFPKDGDDAESLFRNAEAALNKAKAHGERFLFYRQEMNESADNKLAMENQLRQAIDNEEFVLHYQPKVNLISGKITSAEALIRWNDPRTGLVPPGIFIPILESCGLINEVGRWALRKSIEDNLRWRVAGLPNIRIAVNVSPLQLRSINFVDEIKKAVSLDEHAAVNLELEITENVIMQNVELVITSLQAIRGIGVTIAIDDFGTGFSSLKYLSKLPIDTLKIDRAFVIEMNTPEGMELVSTIIILAHALKLNVVAEGVETDEQMRQLLSLNCDEMQGFLFSKPVPADIFQARFLAQLMPSQEK